MNIMELLLLHKHFMETVNQDECECEVCKSEKKDEKIEKKVKKETKLFLKDKIQKLVNNLDYNSLDLNINVCMDVMQPNKKTLIEILEYYQKPKELTLEEKLIADGWIKNKFVNYYEKDMYTFMQSDNSWVIRNKNGIKINEPDKLWITIAYTEDYEIIKKAVELVKSM